MYQVKGSVFRANKAYIGKEHWPNRTGHVRPYERRDQESPRSQELYIREINLVLLLCQKMLKFMFELSLAEKGVSNSRGT